MTEFLSMADEMNPQIVTFCLFIFSRDGPRSCEVAINCLDLFRGELLKLQVVYSSAPRWAQTPVVSRNYNSTYFGVKISPLGGSSNLNLVSGS